MGSVRGTEGFDGRRHVPRAYHPQHQRQVGHGTHLMTLDRHEVSPSASFPRGLIIADITVTT
jgi:hypothetical protein